MMQGPADTARLSREEALARLEESERQRARLEEALARTHRALKEHEERLAALGEVEAVGRLAGSVAHAFNNLLTALACDAELALARLPEGDPARRHLEAVGLSIARGGALVRQLVAFGREPDRTPPSVRVGELLAELEPMLRRLLGERIELALEAAPGLPPVAPLPFEQVLLTLLANARDAMPWGGRLLVRAVSAEVAGVAGGAGGAGPAGGLPGGVELTVADSGEGMGEETRARLFDPLFSTKGDEGDPGLGLAWVRRVIEQAGGAIEVASRPGQGATFRLLLPAATGEGAGEEPAAPGAADAADAFGTSEPPESAPGEAETLLLVEDEENVRLPLAEILADRGFRVLAAADGAEALRLAERHAGPIHLLVTDLVLPGMSGRELAALLAGRRPGMRILYTTGYPDDLLGAEGSPPLLPKPFSSRALLQKVHQVLGSTPA